MARARFRRGFKTINGRKRKHIWAKDGTLQTVPATMGINHRDSLAVFEGLLGSELIGATVQLSHLDIMVVPTDAIPEIIGQVTFGARVFTQSTLGGLTQAEGPGSDPNADWMAYKPIYVSADAQWQGIVQHMDLQYSAQRKLDELGQSVLVSVENTSSSSVVVRYSITWGVLLP